MGLTLTEKILRDHLVDGSYEPGKEIGIRIDQTLTQDATGTMAYLQFESMGLSKIETELSVSYVDHNTVQVGFENADDHRYLQTIAEKYGIHFSRPGNGICHQVHLERFGRPGRTLLGSDSHTPTCGGLGMIAIGAGGLDVAVAMGGGAYYLTCPRVIRVNLVGKLPDWVTAKDVILKVLAELTTKGNVGSVCEYSGEGARALSVPERATITNMGAETGVTTSLFPSDEETQRFLAAQERGGQWVPLEADEGAEYHREMEIDLSDLVPLMAAPHSPGKIVPVSDLAGTPVDQVMIGSCTNSSFADLMTVAEMFRGRRLPSAISLGVAPGSRQVLMMKTFPGSRDGADAAAKPASIASSMDGKAQIGPTDWIRSPDRIVGVSTVSSRRSLPILAGPSRSVTSKWRVIFPPPRGQPIPGASPSALSRRWRRGSPPSAS